MLSFLPAINPHKSFISFSTTSPSSSPPSPRPTVILPGLGNNTGDYEGLVTTLKERYDVPCVVAQVSRIDWLRNAAGLVDPNYWKGTLQPSPVLDWYLKRVEKAISDAKLLCTEAEDKGISLIGHSAGGWLARVYMEKFGFSDISLLLTLGSPHLPPPKGVPGVIDQTRGLLDYVAMNCAPAVYTPELRYICIAGRYIQGARITGGASSPDENTSGDTNSDGEESFPNNGNSKYVPAGPTFRARFVGQGYKQVCGKADVWGDGVVPEMAAHLEGALNISLEGVYHSPVGSDDHTRPWYGSPSVADKWAHHLLN